MRHEPRIAAGVLAAAATMAMALPVQYLFEDSRWLPPALAGVVLVAVAGMLLRWLTARAELVILGQSLVAVLYILVTQLGETTRYLVLPTAETIPTLVEHFVQAQRTITTYSAPAPATAGIVVALIIIVVVVALAVDLSSATATSPTVAGLPLLSLFLVSAANSGGSLHWGWFLVGATLWLAMVVHQSDHELRGWATSIPLSARGDGEGSAARSYRWQAVRMGALGLVAAVTVANLAPHLPTRYVLDGLGRGGSGAGLGTGVRLATQLDLRRSLESPSRAPVLQYTTNDPTPQPLRVAVVDDFEGGFGRMRSPAPEPREGYTPVDPVRDVPGSVGRDLRTMIVQENGIAAPQLPLPALTRSADLGGIPWSLGPDGTAQVQRTPGTYSASFVELNPQDEDFATRPPGEADTRVDTTAYRDDNLSLDSGSVVEITELAESLGDVDDTPIEAAQSIQEYLRGADFEYNLELPPRPDGVDPIAHFLDTKVGYCQQFAATMTLLARARGIPARVVVGFLPGSSPNGRDRVVLASDAHAWPELYFEGVGWIRFEPTPGARAASVPGYSIDTAGSDPASETDTNTSPSSSASSTTTATRDQTDVPQDVAAAQKRRTSGWLWWLLGLLGVVLTLAVMPVTALLARAHRRRVARDDAARVEAAWQELTAGLDDLGLRPPVGSTPRQTGQWLSRRIHLEPHVQERLDGVVATVERARYARPGQDLPELSGDVRAVVERARGTRQRTAQLRSLLWPQDGVETWRSLGKRLRDRS